MDLRSSGGYSIALEISHIATVADVHLHLKKNIHQGYNSYQGTVPLGDHKRDWSVIGQLWLLVYKFLMLYEIDEKDNVKAFFKTLPSPSHFT